MGQGLVTVLGQIARTELGVENVLVLPADTQVGSAGSSSASRQTHMTGGAVQAACRAVREEWERLGEIGDGIEMTREYHHRPTVPLDELGQGDAHVTFAFAAHRAVVDVDTELGLVRVVEIATAQDVGKAMNPLAVEGQIEGGIAQGLGLALMEEIQVVDGLVRNASFTDYLIPTVLDMPPVELDILELGDPDSPYGLRGIGEPPTISSTPAVVAAVRAATGRPLTRVPLRPDDMIGLVKRLIAVARGDAEPDTVIEGARVFSAFTREWLDGDVALADGGSPASAPTRAASGSTGAGSGWCPGSSTPTCTSSRPS